MKKLIDWLVQNRVNLNGHFKIIHSQRFDCLALIDLDETMLVRYNKEDKLEVMDNNLGEYTIYNSLEKYRKGKEE